MKKPANQDAFTLLELMVSSAVLGIVMMVLLTSVTTGLSLWRNTEQKVWVDREGRVAMQLLADDLAGIVNITNSANANFAPRFDTIPNALTPLRFLTLKSGDYQTNPATDAGDICYVEYRFENNALKRAMLGSSSTFAALRTGSAPQILSSNDFETLATNVRQFRVWAWNGAGAAVANAAADASSARAVDFRIEVVDAKELENFRRNNNFNTNFIKRSQQFFSGRAPVPAPR